MIEVRNLVFEYSGEEVLHDVSFSIKEGSIVALVGPNGAGKTTLMRCIAALEKPMAGKITVDSIDVADNPRTVHRRMGYLSDFFGLYNRLSVYQCLKYTAWCQNVPAKEVEPRIKETVEITDLHDYIDKKAATLSRGYRQRLGVALSLMHRPKILLLDEPASGMDPEARIRLSALFHKLKARGLTIIVSSHILAELEDYCTDMLVLRNGRVRDYVSLHEHQKEAASVLTIKLPSLSPEHKTMIEAQESLSEFSYKEKQVECIYKGDQNDLSELLKTLVSAGLPVSGFEAKRKSLQKAYMELAESTEDKT